MTQGKNDLEYVNKNVYGDYALYGSIYLATDNSPDFSDSYNLVYGHHMDSGAMFGDLDNFVEDAYFSEHREGILITPTTVYDLYIFAALETDAYDDAIYDILEINKDPGALIDYIRANALQYDAGAASSGKVLAMSTCAGSITNGRTVVFAYMTEHLLPTPVSGRPGTTTPSDDSYSDYENPFSPDDPLYELFETPTPLTRFLAKLYPSGGRGGDCWALLNLICLILTIFIFLPVHKITAKFGRRKMMRELNEEHQRLLNEGWLVDNELDRDESIGASMFDNDGSVKAAADSMDRIEDVDEIRTEAAEEKAEEELYRVKKFTWKFWIGVALELIISIVAFKGFIDTEDMRLPMVIIDIWTPIMIFWLAACWLTDVLLVRYRKKVEIEDEIEVEIVDLTEEDAISPDYPSAAIEI